MPIGEEEAFLPTGRSAQEGTTRMSARLSASRAARVTAVAVIAAAITAGVTVPAMASPVAIPDFTLEGPSGTVNLPPQLTIVDNTAGAAAPVSAVVDVNGQQYPWSDPTIPITLTGLADGSYEVTVTVTDAQADSAVQAIAFTLDTAAPAFDLVPQTDLSTVHVDDTVAIQLTSDDASFGSYSYALDGHAITGPQGPDDVLEVPAGAVGEHSVSVTARDEVGNTSDAQSVTWTTLAPVVAAVAPVISWVAKPEATTTSTSAHLAIATDGAGDAVSYVLDLPEGAQSASPEYVTGTSIDLTGLSVGRHTIRVVVERGGLFSALDYAWDVVATPVVTPVETPAVTPVVAPAATPPAPVLSADAIPASTIAKGISKGASGGAVVIIQRVVGSTPNGTFDNGTRAAVRAFQRAHGLVADGVVGPLTWASIVDVANGGPGVAPVTATSIPAAQVARGIQQGARGSSVGVVQRIVGLAADGRFGRKTTAAVRAWQAAHGLRADGVVGPLTWAAMTGTR